MGNQAAGWEGLVEGRGAGDRECVPSPASRMSSVRPRRLQQPSKRSSSLNKSVIVLQHPEGPRAEVELPQARA